MVILIRLREFSYSSIIARNLFTAPWKVSLELTTKVFIPYYNLSNCLYFTLYACKEFTQVYVP